MPINLPENLEKLDSTSKRLKYMVDTLGVKQSHMAEKLGISPAGLHYILNNDVKFSKNAKKIAEYLNVSEQWLNTGESEADSTNSSIKTYKIPIFCPDQLKLYYCSKLKNKPSSNDFMITLTAYKNKTICIYITETHFAPKFEIGDMVVFEQEEHFQDGEILLVYLAKTNSITLKYGFHFNDDVVLLSNDETPIKFESTAGDIIVGNYRECLKKSRFI